MWCPPLPPGRRFKMVDDVPFWTPATVCLAPRNNAERRVLRKWLAIIVSDAVRLWFDEAMAMSCSHSFESLSEWLANEKVDYLANWSVWIALESVDSWRNWHPPLAEQPEGDEL